jgi:coproporphyrinogen III oxidase
MTFPHSRRDDIIQFLKNLREEIIAAFEQFEPSQRFIRQPWHYQHEGGGEMAVLRGQIFEKSAVNWSGVGGPAFPMADGTGRFFATGISVITHMINPHAPTAHFNIRFIETQAKCWFGGGYDLTPMGFPYEEDSNHFHGEAQRALAPFGPEIYNTFAQNARKYFYIPHRQKERGVGGLFFDYLNTGNFEQDFNLWKAVGQSFLSALLPIYHRRIHQSYTAAEREQQLHFRAHYVEFNLLYDRGTRFGFQSNGNPEAILCSLPPLVKW